MSNNTGGVLQALSLFATMARAISKAQNVLAEFALPESELLPEDALSHIMEVLDSGELVRAMHNDLIPLLKHTPPPTETPIYFTNIFTMTFGDNDVLIKFGIEDREVNTTPKTQIVQTAVMMTPRSAKIMAAVLTGAIEKFEAEVGPISMPERI